MVKVLFLLLSGKETPERTSMALMTIARQVKSGRYEDAKVILFGTSEEYVANLTGEARESFSEIVKAGALDSACSFVAKKYDIELKLQDMKVPLLPFGERLAHYVNSGYEVITF